MLACAETPRLGWRVADSWVKLGLVFEGVRDGMGS